MTRKIVLVSLATAAALITAFWIVWFLDRSVLAAEARSGYYEFENAFPLADAWVAGCCLAAFVTLLRRRRSAVLFLLLASGGAGFLALIDILYDVENCIYAKGVGGPIEGVINLLTVYLAVITAWYGWTMRRQLDPC